MHNIDENLISLLDNFSDNKKEIEKSKKNIKTKLTMIILSVVFGAAFFPMVSFCELPIILTYFAIVGIVPQVITLKYQGSYIRNIKNIVSSKKNMEKELNNYKKIKDTKKPEIKQDKAIIDEIEKHNARQKELGIAFSDENYYPYIERIKTKTLKR